MGKTADYTDPDPVPAASPMARSDQQDVVRQREEARKASKGRQGWSSTLVSGLGDNNSNSNQNDGGKLLG